MPLEPLADKWRAWNWYVLEIDGHNMQEIVEAVNQAKSGFEKPTVIIAHTIPGKVYQSLKGSLNGMVNRQTKKRQKWRWTRSVHLKVK